MVASALAMVMLSPLPFSLFSSRVQTSVPIRSPP
jgi:hypothetical protein